MPLRMCARARARACARLVGVGVPPVPPPRLLDNRAQAAIFVYWGRFFLPIPRRANITMLIGRPIVVEKVESPTDAQIDAVHQRLLKEMAELFDEHKAALGWGHKRIVFE